MASDQGEQSVRITDIESTIHGVLSRAYLENRVVHAHRTGTLIELKKWVQRNRVLVASIAAAAERQFRRALEITPSDLAQVRYEPAFLKRQLGCALLGLARLDESEELLLASVEELERDPDKAEADLPKAEACMREVVQLVRATQGQDDPHVATVLENLGNMLSVQGKHAETTEILLDVLRIRRSSFGDGHEAVGRTLFNLARSHDKQGEFQRAVECGLGSIVIAVEQYGFENQRTLEFMSLLSGILHRAIMRNEEVQFELDSMRIDDLAIRGVDHPFLEELAVRIR